MRRVWVGHGKQHARRQVPDQAQGACMTTPEDPARRVIDAAAARAPGVDEPSVRSRSMRLSRKPTTTDRRASG